MGTVTISENGDSHHFWSRQKTSEVNIFKGFGAKVSRQAVPLVLKSAGRKTSVWPARVFLVTVTPA